MRALSRVGEEVRGLPKLISPPMSPHSYFLRSLQASGKRSELEDQTLPFTTLIPTLRRPIFIAVTFPVMADQEKPKRSRFDQTEPAKKSRFDRRSRSPPRVKNSEDDSDVGASSQPATSAAAAAGTYCIV